MTAEERKIIKEIKAGNEEVYKAVCEKYRDFLTMTAIKLLGDQKEAIAAVADVINTIWSHRKSIKFRKPIKDCMYKAIKDDCAGRLDRPGIETRIIACFDLAGVSHQVSREVLKTRVAMALDGVFPPIGQSIAMLFILDEKSYYEIACMLRMKVWEVRNELTRSIVKLRLILRTRW